MNFFINSKPAVTSVEEWTREEIGVGADIAKGSQDIKGNCADFVIIVSSSNQNRILAL